MAIVHLVSLPLLVTKDHAKRVVKDDTPTVRTQLVAKVVPTANTTIKTSIVNTSVRFVQLVEDSLTHNLHVKNVLLERFNLLQQQQMLSAIGARLDIKCWSTGQNVSSVIGGNTNLLATRTVIANIVLLASSIPTEQPNVMTA